MPPGLSRGVFTFAANLAGERDAPRDKPGIQFFSG